jgi:hypothetical protein
VGLWGRLSNPVGTLETVPEQGCLSEPPDRRMREKVPQRPANRLEADGPEDNGQHSIPHSRALRRADHDVDCPTPGGAARRPAKPIQRQLSPSEIDALVADYRQGRSLDQHVRQFGIRRRTVADHLQRLGVARRLNLPKLSPTDIERAVRQYQAGDSLATVGRAFSVDASTNQRALGRAGVPIRPGPGR